MLCLKNLSTFTPAPSQMYQFTRLPQGLCNSPSGLAKLTQRLFSQLPFIVTYADDIAMFSKTISEHFDNLEVLFKRVVDDNIKISLSKSNLISDECIFLRHKITKGRISPLRKHIDTILNMPKPKDKSSLKRLLGLLNWVRKYVHNHASKTHEFNDLLKKSSHFLWTDKHDKALNEIK